MQLTKQQLAKKLLSILVLSLVMGAGLWLAQGAWAREPSQWLPAVMNSGLGQVGNTAFNLPNNQAPQDIRTVVASLTNIFLGLLGMIFIILVIAGGFMWMSSAGNADKVEKAKKLMGAGVIGLLIILSAFAISLYVSSRVIYSVDYGTPINGVPLPPSQDLRNKSNDYNNRIF